MATDITTILLILTASRFVAGNCPIDKIHGIGQCSYRIQCNNNIADVKLESDCQASSNYDVKVDVIVQNASDTFHVGADPEFLAMITSLSVHGNWPKTDLSFLETMYKVRDLYIINNNINQIIGSPFRNLVVIKNIDLSHNKITEVEELFQFETPPFKMEKISLAYNSIVEIPRLTFEELNSLIELDLSNNFIVELNENLFVNLTNLQILRLNNNKIKYLNGAMNNLLNLKHLYLRFNEIQKIGVQSIKTINHLETFDISKNLIEDIHSSLLLRHWKHFSDKSICRIILTENHITHIPNVTAELAERYSIKDGKHVSTKLNLANNGITHIEYNAFTSIQLVFVDLSNNKLTDFIVNPDDLMYVKYLNLSGNYLNRLYYESFSSMRNLQNFDLSRNYMEYFPDQSLSNTYNLKYLNITFNDIQEIHSIKIIFHPGGGYLDLSNNGLSALIIPKNEAVGLKELVLNSNNISDAYLIRLTDQRQLSRLDMSNNFIQDLDESSLQLPDTLVYLDLSFNEISKIKPSSFHTVSNLKTLKLSHNQLSFIEYGVFRNLESLMNVDLSFNRIGQLDSKVFMELKHLTILSLRYNGLNILDHESWFSHKHDVKVYLDGNDLSCDWVAKALTDYKRGFSKMYPTVLETVVVGHSIEGISCKQEVQNLVDPSSKYATDERLLVIAQKILEAVQDQTSYLRKYMWHSLLQDAERKAALNTI